MWEGELVSDNALIYWFDKGAKPQGKEFFTKSVQALYDVSAFSSFHDRWETFPTADDVLVCPLSGPLTEPGSAPAFSPLLIWISSTSPRRATTRTTSRETDKSQL